MKKNVFAMLISIALSFAIPVSVPATAVDPAAASTATSAVNTPSPEPSPAATSESPTDTTAASSADTTTEPSSEPSSTATEPSADATAAPSTEPQPAITAAPSTEVSPEAAIAPISEPEETQAEEAVETREWDEILAELPPEAIHMDGITTFVRLRDLSDILGFELDWDDATKAVALTTDSINCRITIGQTDFTCNQATEKLEHPPFIQGERTFIEEDFILWLFGE